MEYVIEHRTETSFEKFNITHYHNYLRAKGWLNIDKPKTHIDLEVVGKTYLYNNKIVVIQYVVKQWYAGFYYMAVYEDLEQSSGTVVVENINSFEPVILEDLKRFQTDFQEINNLS